MKELDSTRFATYDAEGDTLVLEWTAETAEMTEADFRGALVRLADLAEERRPSNLLVDVRRFGYRPTSDFGPWRDAEIIPRYNAAGVGKFAFLVPPGGASGEPTQEAPGNFPTGYFETREAIDAWFSG